MDRQLRNMTSLYLSCDEKLLLLRRSGGIAKGLYVGSAGGHFEPCELNAPRACVLREAGEELGLGEGDISNLKLRYVALRYADGEIRQNYYFFADISPEKLTGLSSNEGELCLVSPEKALALEMPFCPKFVLRHWLETGRFDDRLYGAAATEDGLDFVPMD